MKALQEVDTTMNNAHWINQALFIMVKFLNLENIPRAAVTVVPKMSDVTFVDNGEGQPSVGFCYAQKAEDVWDACQQGGGSTPPPPLRPPPWVQPPPLSDVCLGACNLCVRLLRRLSAAPLPLPSYDPTSLFCVASRTL